MDQTYIIRMRKPECLKYQQALSHLLLDNVHAHAYTASFSTIDANVKIDEMVAYIESNLATVFGCISSTDELIGYIWAYRHSFREEERMYISAIQVCDAYRNLGIGSKLLSVVENEARVAGLPAIYIHTEANNKGAIRLYEREGFSLERVQFRKPINESGIR